MPQNLPSKNKGQPNSPPTTRAGKATSPGARRMKREKKRNFTSPATRRRKKIHRKGPSAYVIGVLCAPLRAFRAARGRRTSRARRGPRGAVPGIRPAFGGAASRRTGEREAAEESCLRRRGIEAFLGAAWRRGIGHSAPEGSWAEELRSLRFLAKKSQGPPGEFHATTSIRGGAFFVHPQRGRESLEKSNKTKR